jgi:hypothetical protein
VARGQVTPVADDHQSLAVHHEKDLLVVAVPVEAYAAVVHRDVQVHVIDGQKALGPFAVGLRAEGVEHPGLDLPHGTVSDAAREIASDHHVGQRHVLVRGV